MSFYKFFAMSSESTLAIAVVMMLSTVIGVPKSAELLHPSITGNLNKAQDQITLAEIMATDNECPSFFLPIPVALL